jgi:nucleoside-diphosphate-sugar epimerase
VSRPRIVVTGASGFVGSGVVARLATRADVVAVSRTPREPGAAGTTHLADLGPAWADTLPGGADAVVWLAQSRRYREFPEGADDMFRVNEAALLAALEWARRQGVGRFIYASTGSVYAPAPGPLTEASPVAATSFYAATKLNGEQLARQYAGFFDVIIARVFGVYGPGQRGMAIGRVAEAAATGEIVTLRGGIGMELTPLFVADAVEVFAGLVDAPLPENPLVLNVAGPEATTLASVAHRAAELAGRTAAIAAEPGEAARLVADTRRLRALLPGIEWHGLAAGLAATFAARGAATQRSS